MTLEELGNLGDFIASIAVIVTLIYLAIQLRQNTRQMKESSADIRQSGLGQLFEMHSRHRFFIASDGAIADLVEKGLDNYDQLNKTERIRFDSFMWDIVWTFLLTWSRYKDGVIAKEIWESALTDLIRQWIGRSGGKAWWESTNIHIVPAFAEIVNEALNRDA